MRKWDHLQHIWQPFRQSGASLHASAACFFLLLSLLPSAAFLLSLLSYFPAVQPGFLAFFQQFIPVVFHPIWEAIRQNLLQNNSAAVLSAAGITTIWSASKGIWAIMNGLDAMLEVTPQSGYWIRRLRSMAILTLFTIILLAFLPLMFWGTRLLLQRSFRIPVIILFSLRTPLSIFLLAVFFALIYRFLPADRFPFPFCLKSGLGVSVMWYGFSKLFSIYVRYFTNRVTLYGGIGLVILSAVWLHLSMIQFLYGMLYVKLLSSGNYHPFRTLWKTFRFRS